MNNKKWIISGSLAVVGLSAFGVGASIADENDDKPTSSNGIVLENIQETSEPSVEKKPTAPKLVSAPSAISPSTKLPKRGVESHPVEPRNSQPQSAPSVDSPAKIVKPNLAQSTAEAQSAPSPHSAPSAVSTQSAPSANTP